jgi:glycerophosphoryl diester phosphodiesterase
VAERRFSQDAERLVVAHRGASAAETENTLPAFELAIAAGADVVEFDVRMSADGVAIVMHDPRVDRTTDGQGLVSELGIEDLRRLRIRTRDGGTTVVPTLEQTLASLSGRVGVDVEIKNLPGEPDFDAERERAVEATVRALDAVAFSGPVLLSSFNPLSLARARELVGDDVATGLLTTADVQAPVAFGFARSEGHPWVLPFVDAVTTAGPAFVGEVHGAAMRVGTWITDDPAVAIALFRTGVDAVATNDPAAIVRAKRGAIA